MQIPVAMLADAATVERGKLYIHGGGWDNISASSFPVNHPSLALVLLFRLEYEEALEPQGYLIDLVNDGDQPQGFRVEGELTVGLPPGTRKGASISVPQQLTVNGLEISSPGDYRFRVLVKASVLAELPFAVTAVGGPGALR